LVPESLLVVRNSFKAPVRGVPRVNLATV